MEIGKVIAQFSNEEQKRLAAAQCAEELSKLAEGFGKHLDAEEAEAMFAILYPVRGKELIDEGELEMILGGQKPRPTVIGKGALFNEMAMKKHL